VFAEHQRSATGRLCAGLVTNRLDAGRTVTGPTLPSTPLPPSHLADGGVGFLRFATNHRHGTPVLPGLLPTPQTFVCGGFLHTPLPHTLWDAPPRADSPPPTAPGITYTAEGPSTADLLCRALPADGPWKVDGYDSTPHPHTPPYYLPHPRVTPRFWNAGAHYPLLPMPTQDFRGYDYHLRHLRSRLRSATFWPSRHLQLRS